MGIAKVANGGSVIVQAGVLAGVGPIGPPGQRGEAGPAGPQGPEGPTGAAGYVVEQIAIAEIAAAQSIGSGSTISVAVSSVLTDDGSWNQSTTNWQFAEAQAFVCAAWVIFDKPANDGDGLREFWLLEDGVSDTIIARAQVPAVVDDDTVVQLNFPFIADPDATYVLKARSTDDLSVAIAGGRLAFYRIGAGPAGPVGPEGPAGPVGPIGPEGPKGDDGDANSGFASYADL